MTISCDHENKKPVDIIGIEIMLCDKCAKLLQKDSADGKQGTNFLAIKNPIVGLCH